MTEKEDTYTNAFSSVIIQKPERIGFMSKLMIDIYAPYDYTIFIDADCLVASNIDWWFSKFKENGSCVSVFGKNVDIATTLQNPEDYYFQYDKCKCFDVKYVPSFNGGRTTLRRVKYRNMCFKMHESLLMKSLMEAFCAMEMNRLSH